MSDRAVPVGSMPAVPVPSDPWNQVADRLYMGGSLARPDRFGAVVTLDGSVARHRPLAPDDAVLHLAWGIADAGWPDLSGLGRVVAFVVEQRRRKVDTLVRCAAGLNRSGLVCAAVLLDDGLDADAAVAAVRAARGPYALCNPAFVELIGQLHRGRT